MKTMKNKIGDDFVSLDSKPLEKALKTAKSVKAKKEAEAEENAAQLKPGIILLEHIPFGFFEKELKGFFSQFGKVLRVRVARSEKTGKSKGYAYIEFEFEDVAKIAAESMDGYLMFERLMKCKVLPSDINPYKVFSKSYIREKKYPKLKSREMVKKNQQIKPTQKQYRDILSARLSKLQEQNKKLAEIGIDYEFDAGHIELPEVKEEEDKPKKVDKKKKSPTPKKLNKKKSVSPLKKVSTPPAVAAAAAAEPESKEKTPKFPKFSPKLLRSRKSDISSLTVAALSSKKSTQKAETAAAASTKKASISNSSPAVKTPKAKAVSTPAAPASSKKALISNTSPVPAPKTPKAKAVSTPAAAAIAEEPQDTKTPKFSPKLLRSRKSDASALQKKTPEGPQKNKSKTPGKTPAKAAAAPREPEETKTPKFPKFSPKLLRSRKSDASALQKKTPEGQKNKSKTPGRKSVR